MKILRQFSIVVGIWMLGEVIVKCIDIPMPGNIMGMLLLFGLLTSNIIKLEMIEEMSDFLLKHLAFFFIPPGVALIASLDILSDKWMSVLLIIVITTIIVMGVTGLTVQCVLKRGEKR